MKITCTRCRNVFSNASGACCGACGKNSRSLAERFSMLLSTEIWLLKSRFKLWINQ